MDNQNVSAPEVKVFAYDTEYARSKKTCIHYWTLDLLKAICLLAVIGVDYLINKVFAPEQSHLTAVTIGLLAIAAVTYLILRCCLQNRADAWFCSFAQRDGKLYHLEFSPRQGFAAFGTLFDPVHNELAIKAAANPDMVNLAISCKEAGTEMPNKTDYKKIKVTELRDAQLTLKGKKITISYTNDKGRADKLVTADCFKGLLENIR